MSEHAVAAGTTFPWHELYTPDGAAARSFYSSVFGWATQDFEHEMGAYPVFVANGMPVAGMMQTTGNPDLKDVPPHWTIYIAVEDVDATVSKVQSLGGSVTVPAMDVPNVGRMAMLSDPQGAMFWVYRDASKG